MTAEDGPQSNAEVILVHASRPPEMLAALGRVPREDTGGMPVPQDQPMPWIFLGQDYPTLLAWERGLSGRFRRLQTARDLDQVAKSSRRPFLDLISRLGRRHASLAWWTSIVSERNTMVSPLFLNCCYLQIGLGQIEGRDGPLCIVAESWAVLRCLARSANARNRPVRWLTPPPPMWRVKLRRYRQMAWEGLRFLKRRTLASRVARRTAPEIAAEQNMPASGAGGPGQHRFTNHRRPCVFLRTFIDEGCLGDDRTFRDRHLPGLCKWLEDKGCDVWTIPVLYGMKRSYLATWDWLYRCRQQFLNPDVYYRVTDILYTLWVATRQAFMPRGRLRLGDLEVTALFDEERLRIGFIHDSLRWILISRLPYRLKRAGFQPDLLIEGYENMVAEKGVITGFRRHMPAVKIVGFQHPVPFPLLLCHFVTADEARFAPLPDRIVCNGRVFRDALIREGLEPERVVEGPALRYAHLWQNNAPHATETPHRPCVLLALPLEPGAAVELLSKVMLALGKTHDLPVNVKPHPMMNVDDLLPGCGTTEMPPNFEFVQGPMAEWLERARVIVSTGSAVLYEAVTAGVPVVTVGREGGLNLNPLAWLEGLDRVCHCPQEIRGEVLRLWNLRGDELADYRRHGEAILRTSFNKVTDERMQVFLDGLAL